METTKKEEFTRVQRVRDNKYNLINAQGKLLLEKWYDWIGNFKDGFAVVRRGINKHNYIDKDGKLLLNEWFKWAENFQDGIARVQREDYSYNLINKQGKLLSNEWFEWVDDFDKYGLAIVYRKNGEKCKIDKNGKIVSE